MTSDEEWRAVVGWDGCYEVSSMGNVRSLYTGRLMSPSLSGRYPAVTLKKKGRRPTTRRLHILVAEAFLGPLPNLGVRVDVCHGDNDRMNNAVTNLRYDTHRNNQRQMAADGRGNIAITHCKHGHEYTPENTWWHGKKRKYRACRACHYARKAARNADTRDVQYV